MEIDNKEVECQLVIFITLDLICLFLATVVTMFRQRERQQDIWNYHHKLSLYSATPLTLNKNVQKCTNLKEQRDHKIIKIKLSYKLRTRFSNKNIYY